MAKRDISRSCIEAGPDGGNGDIPWRTRARRLVVRVLVASAAVPAAALAALISAFSVADPPFTAATAAHYLKSGPVTRESVRLDDLPQHVPLAFIAAEDAGFCSHWGFDVKAIRASGEGKGTSISQQTARNLFLGRSGGPLARALESAAAGMIELILSKRRILEIYLSTNDYGGGVFGVAAAARESFGKPVSDLNDDEAALLAARFGRASPGGAAVSETLRKRASVILDGARLLSNDSRSACIDG